MQLFRCGHQDCHSAHVRAAFLSGLDPVLYNCCPNSCCCYVGPYTSLDKCPYCTTPRYHSDGRPRMQFAYIPLIPRLVALFKNSDIATRMRYRSERLHNPQTTSDIFDSSVYQNLLDKQVIVDGTPMPHKYFSDPRDIALGLSTDGFAPFRHRKSTTWPLIIFIYNLPPELQFLKDYILSVGTIPGLKKPKDMDLFMWLVVEELLQLAVGVHAYNSLLSALFVLHAYLIVTSGDI